MTTQTHLVLVRHGEPVAEAVGTHYGQLDVRLSQVGLAQSAAVAARLAAPAFDAVWSSDLVRALHLARLLGAAHGVGVRSSAALRERHLGVLQGMSFGAADEAWPEDATRLREQGATYRVREGENIQDLAARVLPEIESIVAMHEGQRVLVASHGGPIRALVGHVLGMPFDRLDRIKVDYCSVTELAFRADGAVRVLCVNA